MELVADDDEPSAKLIWAALECPDCPTAALVWRFTVKERMRRPDPNLTQKKLRH
jgi:hypothetical protein